jgi:hypothetical protein
MRVLIPALLIAAGLAGPAAAAPHIPSYSAFSGPELMGDDVMWVAPGVKGAARVEVSRHGSGPARVVARLPNAGPGVWVGHARLHASEAAGRWPTAGTSTATTRRRP